MPVNDNDKRQSLELGDSWVNMRNLIAEINSADEASLPALEEDVRHLMDNTHSHLTEEELSEFVDLVHAIRQKQIEISPDETNQEDMVHANGVQPVTAPNDFHRVQKRTLGCFNHGTSSDEDDKDNTQAYGYGEAVSRTYHIDKGIRNQNKTHVNGPGTDQRKVETYLTKYPEKGYSKAAGELAAYGLDERIKHTFTLIKYLVTKNKAVLKDVPINSATNAIIQELDKADPIEAVNFNGWSRGGAKCFTDAHNLQKDPATRHLEIKIFAYDPVPGLGLSSPVNRQLSENVTFCFVIYAADEDSLGFNPVIPDYHKNTVFIPMVMPGGHAQVVGSELDHAGKKMEGVNLKGVGLVSRFFMQHLMVYHGSDLADEKVSQLKISDLPKIFEEIQQNRKQYKDIAQRVSYTRNENGESRYVIPGNGAWVNKPMNQVLPAHYNIFSPTDKYVNIFHRMVDEATLHAKNNIDTFEKELNEKLSLNSPISDDILNELIGRLCNADHQPHLNGSSSEQYISNVVYMRAICERFQERFKPADLIHLHKRQYTHADLANYIKDSLSAEIKSHHANIELHRHVANQPIDRMPSADITGITNRLKSIDESMLGILTFDDIITAESDSDIDKATTESDSDIDKATAESDSDIDKATAEIIFLMHHRSKIGQMRNAIKSINKMSAMTALQHESNKATNDILAVYRQSYVDIDVDLKNIDKIIKKQVSRLAKGQMNAQSNQSNINPESKPKKDKLAELLCIDRAYLQTALKRIHVQLTKNCKNEFSALTKLSAKVDDFENKMESARLAQLRAKELADLEEKNSAKLREDARRANEEETTKAQQSAEALRIEALRIESLRIQALQSIEDKTVASTHIDPALTIANVTSIDDINNLSRITNKNEFLRVLVSQLEAKKYNRESILALFNELKNPNGEYKAIHEQRSGNRFRLFFKSDANGEKNFWHTATYMKAVKLLKDAYISCPASDQIDKTKEAEFIDYVRGNRIAHSKKTSTRKKFTS